MEHQPKLSDAEWALVVELLQRELEELPAEIRHTRTASYRDDLHQRRQMIVRLLDRLRSMVMV
jgi:hypothetical protein